MKRLFLPVLVAALLLASPTGVVAKRKPSVVTENLVSIVTPAHKGIAAAHPWVNIRVTFGAASNGAIADLTTFKAKLGRCNITDLFEDSNDNGTPGKRARLTNQISKKCRFKMGRRPKNRLKLTVRAAQQTGKRRLKDTDKVRFGVVEMDNQPPTSSFTAAPPGLGGDCANLDTPEGPAQRVTVTFSAATSDPDDGDNNWLQHQWDFGDGSTGAGKIVTHDYDSGVPVKVTLRVLDGPEEEGGKWAESSLDLPAISLDPGRNAGHIQLAPTPGETLDFGAVTVNSTATRTFKIRNVDPVSDTASQVKVGVAIIDDGGLPGAASFQVDGCPLAAPCSIDAGEERPITVVFNPQQAGHAQAVLQLITATSSRCTIFLLVHGYGGSGPNVPWDTSSIAFVNAGGLFSAIRPNGTRVEMGLGTGECEGGALLGAPCIHDGDCPNATCSSQFCVGGAAHGNPCGNATECPQGTCGDEFFASSYCTDGNGAAFFLNEDAHMDPDWNCDPCEVGTILKVTIDGARSIVTQKVTEPGDEAPPLACDRDTNGRLYWADYHFFGVDDDEGEQLKSAKKSGDFITVPVSNINRRLGDVDPENYVDPSDGFIYYEPTIALRVTPDGSERYVANLFGLYRLDPKPLLITRDVDELFDIDPDGRIVVVSVIPATSELRVYKIDPNHAVNGALSLSSLTPWATMLVPNNNIVCAGDGTCIHPVAVNDFAVDSDGNVFVNLFTGDRNSQPAVLPQEFLPRGTVRFEPVGTDGASGRPTGFVELLPLDNIDF